MKKTDVDILIKALAPVMYALVSKQLPLIAERFDSRISQVEKGLKEVPCAPDLSGLLTHEQAQSIVAEATRDFQRSADTMGKEEITGLISEAVKSIPAPEKGDKGESVAVDDVMPELMAELHKAIAALPVPKDGEDGKSVTVADIEPALEAVVNKWALEFERRAQDVFQRAIDRMPKAKDGDNGKDGLGFDDMTVEHDGERGFTLRFARGDQTKEFAFSIPSVIDRGFWKDGASVAKGDGVTFGGSYWIAQKDTDTKPETGNADWRLAVKKGRDGKDGDRGEKGEAGKNLLVGVNGKVIQ